MSEDDSELRNTRSDNTAQIIKRQVDPDPETAEYDFLAIIAELEQREIDELPSLYDQLDHFIEQLYKNPPSRQSQLEINFTYDGYRVTMDQHGQVTIVDTKPSLQDP